MLPPPTPPPTPRYVREAAKPIGRLICSLLAPGGAAVITDPGRVVAEEFVRVCREELGLHVVRHEVPFVRTSISIIPKLLVLVVTRVADGGGTGVEGNRVAAAVEQCVAYYREHRANCDTSASSVKTCVFTA